MMAPHTGVSLPPPFNVSLPPFQVTPADLRDELASIEAAAKVSTQGVGQNMGELTNGLRSLEKEVEARKADEAALSGRVGVGDDRKQDEGGGKEEVEGGDNDGSNGGDSDDGDELCRFTATLKTRVVALQASFATAAEQGQAMLAFLGESGQGDPREYLGRLSQFVASFQTASEENARARRLGEKRRQVEAARLERDEEQASRARARTGGVALQNPDGGGAGRGGGAGGVGVFDKLLMKVKTGAAFEDARKDLSSYETVLQKAAHRRVAISGGHGDGDDYDSDEGEEDWL